MAEYIIGIDQSTQSTKVFLYDRQGKIVAKASRKHRQIINDQGWISHDLSEIYANLLICVKAIFADPQIHTTDIKAVGLTNQRETVAAWDRDTGEPLSKAVVWQDARSEALCQQLQQREPNANKLVVYKSGLPISPYFPAAKMAWLLANEATVTSAATKGNLCLGTIDSWLLYRLTSGNSFYTEPSNACRTELMNLTTRQWDPELLKLFGISKQYLPEIIASDSNFGQTDFDGILAEPIPIYGVLGDSEGALYGQGGTHCGDLKATYGTGSSIMINVGNQPVRSKSGLVTSIGWQQGSQVAYVLEGNINYTGALVTWLKDSLQLIHEDSETEELAMQANIRDKTVIVPAFTGLGAPHWENNARATILNMSTMTKRAELVKASLESIALQIQDVIESAKDDVAEISDVLYVDGGPTHNNYLMQCQSDLSNVKIAVPNNEDMSAFGAALMAGNAIGFYDDKHTDNYIDYRYYQPEMTLTQRSTKLHDWQNAIMTVKEHAQKR